VVDLNRDRTKGRASDERFIERIFSVHEQQ
ncbi:uncharacterized protein METZ01_LOCUS270880, partial [marine metagenome]